MKRPIRIPRLQQVKLADDIGKYISSNAEEVTWLCWTEFVRLQRMREDFASLSAVDHPAQRLSRQYKHRSAPVVLMMGKWMEEERLAALALGPQNPAIEYAPFLPE